MHHSFHKNIKQSKMVFNIDDNKNQC